MTELQVGVRHIAVELERLSVGIFGLREAPRFLQRVTILDPYRRVVRILIERVAIEPGGR